MAIVHMPVYETFLLRAQLRTHIYATMTDGEKRLVVSRCVSYTTCVLYKYCILYISIDLKAMGMGTRPELNWLRSGTNGSLL